MWAFKPLLQMCECLSVITMIPSGIDCTESIQKEMICSIPYYLSALSIHLSVDLTSYKIWLVFIVFLESVHTLVDLNTGEESLSALLCLLLRFTGLYIFNYGSDSFAPVLEWLQTGFAQVIHLKVWKPPVTGILMWRQCRICFSSCIFNVPPAL